MDVNYVKNKKTKNEEVPFLKSRNVLQKITFEGKISSRYYPE
jgi:hypothetical protein